ncbi:MAG: RNA-binding protein [Treponema sp.]|nr:RNA-binding protein [Treponema sp.]
MAKRIYAGNLSFDTNEESLTSLFKDYGEILSLSIIRDKVTGSSKGFAFVELEDNQKAMDAVHELSGISFEGRKIRVSIENDEKPGNRAMPYKKR